MNLERIVGRLGEPGLALSGTSHWQALRDETGIVVPADFRQFVDAYGPGQLNGAVYFYHPSHGAELLGDYVRSRAGEWAPVPEKHAVPLPFGVGPGHLTPVALSFSGVDLLFRVEEGDPADWHVCAFAGDVDEFVDFGFGFAEWLDRYLDGDEAIEPYFDGCGESPSSFESELRQTG